jgi:hypothetical protein
LYYLNEIPFELLFDFKARKALLAAVHLAIRLLRPMPTNFPSSKTSTQTRIFRPGISSGFLKKKKKKKKIHTNINFKL